jgi:ABC-type branched-subunit amino acid transport system substrate-binding protein
VDKFHSCITICESLGCPKPRQIRHSLQSQANRAWSHVEPIKPAPIAASVITTTTAATAAPPSGDPILIGVSGPLTGQNAQYGAQWKAGFDLALDEINSHNGINGRPLNYVFEDSQSDPRQSITIAQKFVSDPRILIELGDFSSPA